MTPPSSPHLLVYPHQAAVEESILAQARRTGAALAHHQVTFGALTGRLARQHANPRVMDSVACRLVWEDTTRALAQRLPGLPVEDLACAQLAQDAAAAARDAMVGPQDFLAASALVPGDGVHLVSLARLYGAVEARKEEESLWDVADLTVAALEAVTQGARSPSPLLHIHGMLDLGPSRVALLGALGRQAAVRVHLPDVLDRPVLLAWLDPLLAGLEAQLQADVLPVLDPVGGDGPLARALGCLFGTGTAPEAPVELVAAPDPRAMVDAAVDAVRRALDAGATPRQVALVVRRLTPLLTTLLRESAGHAGLTLRLDGPPAAVTTLQDVCSRLLRAVEGQVHSQDLEPLALLAGLPLLDARAFSDATAPRLRGSPPRERARLLQQDTPAPLAKVLSTMAAATTVEGHVAAMRAALGVLPGVNVEGAAALALEQALQTVATAAVRAGGTVLPHRVFSALLWTALAAVQDVPPQDGVTVTTAPDVPGRQFDTVVLLDVTDGTFPEAAPRNPLLTDEDRRALNRVLGRAAFRTEEESLTAQSRLRAPPRDRLEPLLFLSTLGAAQRRAVVLTSQVSAGGRLSSPGPFFLELQRVLERSPSPGWPLATPRALRRLAGQAARAGVPQADPVLRTRLDALRARAQGPGAWSGQLGDAVIPVAAARVGGHATRPTSASALQTLGECGFRFLAEQLLGLKAYAPSEDVPPPELLGTAAHEVLEHFVGARLGKPFAAPSAAERASLTREILAQGKKMPGNPTLKHAVLLTLGAQVVESLDRLALEPPLPGAVPTGVETPFGRNEAPPLVLPLSGRPPLYVRGSLDRVDVLPDGTRVAVDYKLGGAAGNADKLGASSLGQHYLQLPIYLLALQAMGPGPVVGYLWSIRHARATPPIGDGTRFNAAQILSGAGLRHDGMEQRLMQLSDAARGGHFLVKPEKDACRFCPHESVCRISETPDVPEYLQDRGSVP